MKIKIPGRIKPLHRSFTLDAEVVAMARRLVPAELSGNLNRIVNMALLEFVEKRSRLQFERQMGEMAQDLALKRASEKISKEFRGTDSDGL